MWGVNEADMIYYREGTYGDKNAHDTKWINIDGRLKWVTSGPGYIYGVNEADQAWIRYTSAANPTGGEWIKMKTQHFQL